MSKAQKTNYHILYRGKEALDALDDFLEEFKSSKDGPSGTDPGPAGGSKPLPDPKPGPSHPEPGKVAEFQSAEQQILSTLVRFVHVFHT